MKKSVSQCPLLTRRAMIGFEPAFIEVIAAHVVVEIAASEVG